MIVPSVPFYHYVWMCIPVSLAVSLSVHLFVCLSVCLRLLPLSPWPCLCLRMQFIDGETLCILFASTSCMDVALYSCSSADVDPCDSTPCGVGSVCSGSTAGYNCTCLPGYEKTGPDQCGGKHELERHSSAITWLYHQGYYTSSNTCTHVCIL